MSDLVDTRPDSPARNLMRRVSITVAVLGFIGLAFWMGWRLVHSKSDGPKRQVAKIALLPDTPPPPPPPPPDKPKIEPKTETKQQLKEQKADPPPEPQQLKMEGAAGEGPSPFTAGEVKNDYIGGDVGNGERFAWYAGRVAQFIQDELTRRRAKIGSGRVKVWLSADGGVERFEVIGAAGDAELRTTMADIKRFPDAPPAGMPMPMGLEISTR